VRPLHEGWGFFLYTDVMKLVLNVDEEMVARAREKAASLGKSLNDYLVGIIDAELDMEEFMNLSGKGNSRGWKFNRDEIYEH
jgi:hypothetical protein